MARPTTTALRGVLIYAFNNETIDYFQQAQWCADRVRRYLDLPTTIVTDQRSIQDRSSQHRIIIAEAESGGSRWLHPSQEHGPSRWYNAARYRSYDVSPYEQTLVLDSDYVICSDTLLRLFESDLDVTAMKHVYDVTGRSGFQDFDAVPDRRTLHHYWATVLYFRKSQTAQDVFDMMTMIKENYLHYANIYGFRATPFRNDYAVSIALNTVYGHVPDCVPMMPWSMANVYSDVDITQISDDCFDLTYMHEDRLRRTRLSGQDFHFMNKTALVKLYEN